MEQPSSTVPLPLILPPSLPLSLSLLFIHSFFCVSFLPVPSFLHVAQPPFPSPPRCFVCLSVCICNELEKQLLSLKPALPKPVPEELGHGTHSRVTPRPRFNPSIACRSHLDIPQSHRNREALTPGNRHEERPMSGGPVQSDGARVCSIFGQLDSIESPASLPAITLHPATALR